MEERNRAIRELTECRREYQRALDDILEGVGRDALSSLDACVTVPDGLPKEEAEDLAEYRRLLRDTASARERADSILSAVNSLKESKQNERETSIRIGTLRKGLRELDGVLGEAVLAETVIPEVAIPFRSRLEELNRKLGETESRILELEHSDSTNILSVLGKGLQSVLLRSTLSSRSAEIRRLYAEAGRALGSSADVQESDVPRIRDALETQGRQRAALGAAEAELALYLAARNEAEDRLERMDAGHFPTRGAKAWEDRAETYSESLQKLCRSTGERITSSLTEADIPEGTRERIRALRESQRAADLRIEKLETAIELELRAEDLLRLKRAKAKQERRIEEDQLTLASLERRIEETESRIIELSKK